MSLNHQRSIFSNSFLTHYIVTQLISLVTQSCLTLYDSMNWNSPGKNTGVGCHFLLQVIFPNSEIESGSSALQAASLPPEPPGKQLTKLIFKYLQIAGKFHSASPGREQKCSLVTMGTTPMKEHSFII